MRRRTVVRETNRRGSGSLVVASFAATSAISFPVVPICAGVHRLRMVRWGRVVRAARTIRS
jgi:hypothetical protein